MSYFCIYEHVSKGSYYEPSKIWCEIDANHSCKDYPFHYSKEDYEDDRADFLYDNYKDSFDFL